MAYTLYTGSPANRPKGYLFTSSEQSVAGTAAVAVNTWSHFAATYDCTTLRLYVDGFQVASQAIAGGAITNSTGALRLGGNSVWGEYFQGRIDDVRLYNRDLAQSEIQADMATGVIGGPESAGIYRGGWWYLDTNGNNG